MESPSITSPGELIRREIETRGWTQADLARILGRPLPTVNEIIAGKKSIMPEMAVALGTAFGNGAEFWTQSEATYRLSLIEKQNPDVAARARLYDFAPIKDMQKRQWIRPTENAEDLEKELCRFFEISSLDEEPKISAMARKTTGPAPLNQAQKAWVSRAKKLATTLHVAEFEKGNFERGCDDLKKLVPQAENVSHVPKILSAMGVRFVVVEPLPHSKIDGAAFWISENMPVIVLSARYDKIDSFWFTLAHELSHIRHADEYSVDVDIVGEESVSVDEMERRANKEGSDMLIPTQVMESFILRVKPLYSKTRIIQFANRIKVHPGIVTGQLQHRHEIGWQANREMLVKVRHLITSSALTDGWGHSAPIL